MMYEVTGNVIRSGNYELNHILTKIDTLWLQGSLTDVQRQELIDMARTHADPSRSYAPLQAQIDALAARVAKLEGMDAKPEAYPAYVQPTGAHDAYRAGDQVTFNGERYLCIAPEGVAVIWSPAAYPAYWEAVAA